MINLIYDTSVNSAPVAFKTALADAAQFFENNFANPITVNIDVGYGEIAGYPLGGALGESLSYLYGCSYSQIADAMRAEANTSAAATAAASLPTGDPTNGGQFWVTTAEAKALGLPGYGQGLDGYVGFSSTFVFDYNNNSGVTPGEVDFFGVAAHEISEVLGRQMMDGASNGYEPLDLFHYSAPGVHSFTGTQTGYFSIDSGTTNLDNFNTNPSGDFGDWASSVGTDAFLAFCPSGIINGVSSADLTLMYALGWTPILGTQQPRIHSFGDFTGDGKADILWRNANGDLDIWTMNGTTVTATTDLGIVSTGWSVAGIADFNGDGKADLLWRNTNGDLDIWTMNGTTVTATTDLGIVSTAWTALGLGDFNGDGKSDILWRNINGDLDIWTMNGTTVTATTDLGIVNTSWSVVAAADFNGDSKSDILWRNANGDLDIWTMSGTTVTATTELGIVNPSWSVVGLGDFNADGKSDILWRNTNGDLDIWTMNGTTVTATTDLGIVNTSWSVATVADVNGDGKSDILWRNTNGDADIWTMNGTTVSATTDLGIVATNWTIQKPVLAAGH